MVFQKPCPQNPVSAELFPEPSTSFQSVVNALRRCDWIMEMLAEETSLVEKKGPHRRSFFSISGHT
ncbi:hypothetical protein BGW80DRAFT_1294143 [Lactifluus volemus]|nr:hypothetical protein BGW80DRAFT_1294143 [Lactifluus volemus]